MLRKITGSAIYVIKIENVVVTENYCMHTLKSLSNNLAEIELKDDSELLLKASLVVKLGKAHTLYLKKNNLIAYERDSTIVNLKKIIIQNKTIEVFEIIANQDTEVIIDSENNAVVEFKGAANFAYVLGWIDNLPTFKFIPTEKEGLFLEWSNLTNVILQI